MYTLDICHNVFNRTELVVGSFKDISNLFNHLLPKDVEVKMYHLGIQCNNASLNTAYEQLVDVFSHELITRHDKINIYFKVTQPDCGFILDKKTVEAALGTVDKVVLIDVDKNKANVDTVPIFLYINIGIDIPKKTYSVSLQLNFNNANKVSCLGHENICSFDDISNCIHDFISENKEIIHPSKKRTANEH